MTGISSVQPVARNSSTARMQYDPAHAEEKATAAATADITDRGSFEREAVTEPGKGAGLEVETLLAEMEAIVFGSHDTIRKAG
jgi:hypothetical protein